jgi:hypothetical protein
LESPQFRAELAQRARERVLSNHTWASSMRQLDALLEGAASKRVEPEAMLKAVNQ